MEPLFSETNGFNEQEVHIIVMVNTTASILSLLGTIYVVVHYILLKSLRRQLSYRLILWVAVSDAICESMWCLVDVRIVASTLVTVIHRLDIPALGRSRRCVVVPRPGHCHELRHWYMYCNCYLIDFLAVTTCSAVLTVAFQSRLFCGWTPYRGPS